MVAVAYTLYQLNVIFFLNFREGARVIWSYVDRILGQPSLIRESSLGKYPWSGVFKRALNTIYRNRNSGSSGDGFGDVILHPPLQKRIQHLANSTANTKAHQAPFRNMLFYGPPGTGKTMAARELARKSVRCHNLFLVKCGTTTFNLFIFILIEKFSTFC